MPADFKQYFAIANKLKSAGIRIDREELIWRFTQGRKNSLTQLTDFEYKELITSLNKRLNSHNQSQAENMKYDQKENNMRRKVIALLCKIGYVKNGKADMDRINEWCKNRSYLKQTLNSYDRQTLPKLITQAEIFYQKHLEKL